jgi:hypothetical protein
LPNNTTSLPKKFEFISMSNSSKEKLDAKVILENNKIIKTNLYIIDNK